METIEVTNFLIKKVEKLWEKYKNKAPVSGAPVDDYFIMLGQEFHKTDDDAISRAYMADVDRTKAVIVDDICCASLAVGGKGQKAIKAGKTVELEPLLVDSEFVDDLKKRAKNPFMMCLAMSISERASWLGGDVRNEAIEAFNKGKENNAPVPSASWLLLATKVRVFDALAQGRPVNVPDIAYGLIEYVLPLRIFCIRLAESVCMAVTTPNGLDYDETIHSLAEAIVFADQQIAVLLACCNIPGVTADGNTIKVEFSFPRTVDDFSTDEITYLIKKAQDMTPTAEIKALKDKCIKANSGDDWRAIVKAVADYLDAIRKSL